MVHHDKRRQKKCKSCFFFPPEKRSSENVFSSIFGVTGLQMQDELKQTSLSRPARKKVVLDPLGWSQGAQNAEVRENNFLLKIVTFSTKN